ncbi:MAG: dATP/dGTP diphosphohydrolase domain-containing protein [bacterium]
MDKDKSKFVTSKGGGYRFNQNKQRYELVHPKAHSDFVDVLTMGAEKYEDRNWENGMSWTSVLASLKRHIAAFENGEDYDQESGKLHIAHAACNVHFLNAYYYIFPQGDDRPKKFLNTPKIGLDIDGVLADFVGSWTKIYPDISIEPNSWYFDRNIIDRFNKMKDDGSLDDFYLNIEPLISSHDLKFEPYCYITSRPVDTQITENWLDKHGFPRKNVHTVDVRKTKVDIAKEVNVDIFIDDCFDNFVDLNKNGVFCYLYSASHNMKYDVGHMRLNSLNDLDFI